MAYCPKLDKFKEYIKSFDQAVEIEKDKDSSLRYNVWETTVDIVKALFTKKGTDALPKSDENSEHVIANIKRRLESIKNSSKSAKAFIDEVINADSKDGHNYAISNSIALYELMESIKGEADKARNLSIKDSKITSDGVLPALPLSRVAGSIGRKIAYQMGVRFHSTKEDATTAEEIEALYYGVGKTALLDLVDKGYVKIHENTETIQDYISDEDRNNSRAETNVVTDKFMGVSLVESKFNIEAGTEQAKYFLNRTESNLKNTKLGVATDVMRAVRDITQPSKYTLMDTEATMTEDDLAELDNQQMKPSPTVSKVRKKIYDNPVFVHGAVHDFVKALSAEASELGVTASTLIFDLTAGNQALVNSLFGIKNSQDYSVDKKESVSGQNTSKTTPLNDHVEYFDAMQEGNEGPVPLHQAMKTGRNPRLYMNHSVLNAHGSKHSRYSLTAGEYTVDSVDDLQYLVYQVYSALGDKDLTYKNFMGETSSKLDKAVEAFAKFEAEADLDDKLHELSIISSIFPGTDYATLLTTMKAVQDIRNPVDGKVTTEFMASSDATGSGGTITFMHALGTNDNVKTFLQQIGLLEGEISEEEAIDDIYGIMSKSIKDFIEGENIPKLIVSQDGKAEGVRSLMEATADLLFDQKKAMREWAKDPTMTFIYGQGRNGAIETMTRLLADRVIDNLGDPDTRKYLATLLGDNNLRKASNRELNDIKGLYDRINKELSISGLPGQIYDIMDASINKQYLKGLKARTKKVIKLINKLEDPNKFRIMPAAAKLDDIEPTLKNLKEYGMPISKLFEVSSPIAGSDNDTVLTYMQKMQKTILEVSTIHGVDAAQLYHALNKVMDKHGVVVVHDEVRGTLKDVRAMEAEFRTVTIEIISNYDIHEAAMHAIAAYDPKVAESAEYISLMTQIQEDVAQKKEIMENEFNNETSALIGDGQAYHDFAVAEGETETTVGTKKTSGVGKIVKAAIAKAEAEKKAKIKKDESNEFFMNSPMAKFFGIFKTDKNIRNVHEFIAKVAPESPLFTKYLETAEIIENKGTKKDSSAKSFEVIGMDDKGDRYTRDTKTVSITGRNLLRKGKNQFKKLDLNNPKELAEQVTVVEHEIVHAATIPYLQNLPTNPNATTEEKYDVYYVERANTKLKKLYEAGKLNNLSDSAKSRLDYIMNAENKESALYEFMAIMAAETEVANEFYKALTGKIPKETLQKRIARIFQKIKEAFLTIAAKDFDNELDAEKLQTALMNTIVNGIAFSEEVKEEYDIYAKTGESFGINTKTKKPAGFDGTYSGNLAYANYAVASMLTSKMERHGKRLTGLLHDKMVEVFPIYSDAADKAAGIYDNSKALQQLVHTITGEGIDKSIKANILAQYAEVMGQHTEQINDQIGKIHKAMHSMSDKEKATVGRFVTDMPLHDYFVLADELTTEEAIATEVTKLEKEVNKKQPDAISDINSLIQWNVMHKDDGRGNIYNLATSYPMGDTDFAVQVRKLMALKSIQAIGAKDFVKLLENTELTTLIKDNSVANRISLLNNEGESNLSDSMLPEYYKEDFITKVITQKDFKMYDTGEDTGWKVLRRPEGGDLGVVYKQTIDATSIPGAFTDIKLANTDILVEGDLARNDGVVSAPDNTYKLRLTHEEKLTLGLVEDFSQALVKGTAHSMAIKESQIIRDTLLKEETRMVVGDNTTEIEDVVKSDNVDNPWFIKLKDGVEFADMPKAVQAKYSRVGNRVSNVKGFSDEVSLVRKDISHWLMGDSAKSLVTNPQAKWVMRIVKDLVAGAKIGMVVLNPIKIAKDNISNVAYLGAMGVTPVFVAKNYKEITKDFQGYSDLQRKIIQLKVKLVARPESDGIKKQIKSLQHRLSRNSLGDLSQKGFINSLGSDLVSRNADTLSGLQADMHTALEYLLHSKDGKKNYVSHFILKLQDLGFSGEDFLTYIGNIAQTTEAGKGVQKELDQVHDRLKEIRTEQDIVNYVSQYTNSPASEAVRLGSAMTDLTDVLAKETLYRHLVQNENFSAEDAKIKVLDSFPDYKENMPLAVKQLSDIGIIMFPSFWLRIQKVIYRLARDKPINLASELMLEEAFGANIETIIKSNIVNKSNTFSGIWHTPLESTGAGSFIPLHLWG